MKKRKEATKGGLGASVLEGSPFTDQIKNERDAMDRGYSRRRRKSEKDIEKGRGSRLAPVQSFTRRWHTQLLDDLVAYRKSRPKDFDEQVALRVIRKLKPELLAQIVISRCVSYILKYPKGASVSTIGADIGQDIRAATHSGPIERAMKEIIRDSYCPCRKCTGLDDATNKCSRKARYRGVARLLGERETTRIIRVAREKRSLLADETEFLNNKLYRQVGIALVTRFRYAATVFLKDENNNPVEKPAFHIDTVAVPDRSGDKWRTPLSLIPIESVNRQLAREIEQWRYRRPHYPFSLVTPPAWADPEAGGYIIVRKGVIANGSREQYDALKGKDLSRMFKGLDAMGAVAMQGAPKVLEVVDAIAQNKVPGLLRGRRSLSGRWTSALDNIPPIDDEPGAEVPAAIRNQTPDGMRAWYKTEEGAAWRQTEEGRKWRFAYRRAMDNNKQLSGLREIWSLQLDELRRAAKHDRFYFGHQICFRGRAMPQELFFSLHGPDVLRGSLRHATPGVMNDEAEYWLAVNAANHYGHGWDKKPFDERAKFPEEFKQLIDDVNRDPLNCLEWTKAEEQFQFLSACIALRDPEHAVRCPVFQDATCNGLQHFAAAGRDPIGAAMCNLVNGPSRVSAYPIVADAVKPLLLADGRPLARKIAAVISGSIVKTPVLATPYGVTQMGASDQLIEAFADIGWKYDEAWEAGIFLTDFVFQAMHKVAPATMLLMDWIRRCTKLICKPTDLYPNGRPLEWTSPMGLPVLQDYRKHKQSCVTVDGHDFYIGKSGRDNPIDPDAQVAGSAPNVVHSWDASHGSAYCTRALREGHESGLIYDCIESVASSISDCRRIFREEFVALHERDLIGELYEQWSRRYPDVKLPSPPAKGTFDIRHALNSTYMVC